MTREEEIINEAKSYYSGNIKCYDAFVHGVKWADENPKNIWHDASEIPNNHEYIMFMPDPYTIKTDYIPTCLRNCQLNRDSWNEFVKDMNIKRWAYIKDLPPKGGEND